MQQSQLGRPNKLACKGGRGSNIWVMAINSLALALAAFMRYLRYLYQSNVYWDFEFCVK